jgi:hypothetical protein
MNLVGLIVVLLCFCIGYAVAGIIAACVLALIALLFFHVR